MAEPQVALQGTASSRAFVSCLGAALLKLLEFGSKLLLHLLPCLSDIWLQCSNGQRNLENIHGCD